MYRNYGRVFVHVFKPKVWIEVIDDLMGNGYCKWDQKVQSEIA